MKPSVAPWFQPKTKAQWLTMVIVMIAVIVGAWVGGIAYLKKAAGALPPPVIQKARNLYEERRYDEAVAILQEAIRGIEQRGGPEDTSLVKHFDLLATIYGSMKKDADAEPLWRRSWEIRRKNLGPDHPESIGSGDKLGLTLMAQGKYPEAETLLRKSLTHRETYYGAENSGVMVSLNHMAELFLAQKKYAEAFPFADRAVKIGRSATGLMPASYPDSAQLLAACYAGQEKWEDAAPLYEIAVKFKVRQLPDAPHIPPKAGQISHADFADLCRSAAAVYRKAGREKDAKELETKAEAVMKPKDP